MSYAMYPAVFEEYAVHRNTYGDISKLDSDMVGIAQLRYILLCLGRNIKTNNTILFNI